MRKRNNKIFVLYAKSLNGELNEYEKRYLEEWLAASEENQRMYNELKEVWKNSKPPVVPDIPDIDNEWMKFQHQLQSHQLVNRRKINDFIKNIFLGMHNFLTKKYVVAVYAAVILLVIVGFFLWEYYFTSTSFKVITPKGEKTLITLSDGTKVHLNCESSLKCGDGYGRGDRKVYLEGEAYFEVIKNRQNFTVITSNSSTKVLGTKFNVWARGEETRVVVETGIVLLNKKHNENGAVKLEKGEMGLISGKHPLQKIESVDTEKFLGWMNGRLIFERQSINKVMDELSRVYNVSIELADSTLSDHTLTATFDNLPFNSIINSICLTLGSKYRYENNEYIIY